ncbi:hypothetical protein [Bosea lathyri]|nr:hypothetical protein [Bosea lathyri]
MPSGADTTVDQPTDRQQGVLDGTFGVRSATDEERAAVGIAPSVLDEPSVQQAIAKRERGQPSPGKARRTKAEIAEDEAADAVDDANITTHIPPALNISSGEERVDPSIVAQDAADEAAESAAARTSGAPTLDDLRRLMGDVQRKHGMAVAAKLPGLIGKGVGELTDEELPKAISAVQFVLENGLSNVSDEPAKTEATPAATKQDLVAAMLDYALFADGQNADHAKMPHTMEDVAVVFGKLFGAEVSKLSQVPADGYAKAIAGIAEMKSKDVFKRGGK